MSTDILERGAESISQIPRLNFCIETFPQDGKQSRSGAHRCVADPPQLSRQLSVEFSDALISPGLSIGLGLADADGHSAGTDRLLECRQADVEPLGCSCN